MRILQISSLDLTGQRFNGQYLIQYLKRKKNQVVDSAYQLVWEKQGTDENTAELLKFPFSRILQKIGNRIEWILSIRALLHPSTFLLPLEKFFRAADVVHYQLIYWPNFFSLLAFPFLSRLKPSVWTIHDLFPITGHCVYPFSCERWKIGCGSCPDLKINFMSRRDYTHLNWKIKKALYKKSNLHLVVASQFMYDRVSRSPLTGHLPISLVPFGLDLQQFSPGDSALAKRLLGIAEDEIVISFRATYGEFKGFEYVMQALREIKTDKKICLLSFSGKFLLEEFRSKYKIVDLGWVNDEEMTLNAYRASDFFLMPSTQEAFGMMAMEAMACGKPVVVFDGTSLPEVVGGSEIGLIVRQGDLSGLAAAMNNLINSDSLRLERGKRSREFAEKNYDIDLHFRRLREVYEQTLFRFKNSGN